MIKKFLIDKKISIKQASIRMKTHGLKSLFVINQNSELIGSVSGGDIRSAFLKNLPINYSINKIINKNPKYIYLKDKSQKKKISQIFEKYKVDQIPVVDEKKKIKKIISWTEFYTKKKTIKKKFFNLKNYKFKVVIMAGGKGSRLRPFTDILPKPLIPLKNKTIIEYIISSFQSFNVKEFIISTNFNSQILKSYLKEKFKNLQFNYVEEKKPLGTVGALSKLTPSKTYLVSNCDVYHKINYKDFLNFHNKNKNYLTLVTAKKKYPIPYGVCQIENNQLKSLKEKPQIKFYINTGLYLIDKKIIKLIPKNKFFDLNNLLDIMIKKKYKIGTFKIKDKDWHDVGRWDEFSKAMKLI